MGVFLPLTFYNCNYRFIWQLFICMTQWFRWQFWILLIPNSVMLSDRHCIFPKFATWPKIVTKQVRQWAPAGFPAAPGRTQEGQRDGEALHRGRGSCRRQKCKAAKRYPPDHTFNVLTPTQNLIIFHVKSFWFIFEGTLNQMMIIQ